MGQNGQKRPNQKKFLAIFILYDLIWQKLLTVSKSHQKWPNESHFRMWKSRVHSGSKNSQKTAKNCQKRSNQKMFWSVSNLYDLIWRTPLTISKSRQKWPNEAIFKNHFPHFCTLVTNGPTPLSKKEFKLNPKLKILRKLFIFTIKNCIKHFIPEPQQVSWP